MLARDYVRLGYSFPGSVDWGAARIQRLLEDEEHRRRIARANRTGYSPEPSPPPIPTLNEYPFGTEAWGAHEILELLERQERVLQREHGGQRKQAGNQDPAFILVDGADWTTGGAAVGGVLGGFTGAVVGGVGGGAACTPVAPGVGTLACGVGGGVEGAAVGGGIGAALGAAVGSGIDALTSDDEEELEEFCRRLYAGDTQVCNMIARKRGKRKAALCHASAADRYASCLRGLPLPPLITWNN